MNNTRFNKSRKLEGKSPLQPFDVLNAVLSLFTTAKIQTSRQLNALLCLVIIITVHISSMVPAFAQTPVVPQGQQQQGNGDNSLSPDGKTNQNTVPSQYDDAVGTMYKVDQAVPTNQNNINDGVNKILTGNYAPVVFQAAEQGQGNDVQKAANNILNASLGSVNDTYRGLHQWWKDDLVGNLFQNIGQLIGKWLSELIDGWIADTAQFLAKFLRVFVLNPNIAVNGLNGSQNDGISPYIRQGADVMYGIAIDLLLLLFILCIWKFWAEASYNGAGNLMGPVGRLIFTSGLLLAWPTIYAFEIQISNEMIKAIYFNSADQVLMLDYALAQAVKGGVIAAGAGATSVFAPLLANLAIPVAGQFVGSLFYFASTMIFTILGGILIAELVYILILKAIQTALLTAQYMFAPIFLVFFATPDTESYATGYVKAFVETSLWTFVWVGLLKIMTIILFSNFNPWGKILISIGVLQLMIQVPTFIGRAQIGPASDFITAGLVFGTMSKALGGLSSMSTSLVDKGVGWFTNDRFADKGLQQTKDTAMTGLPGGTQNPELLNSLNKASATERDKNKMNAGADPNILAGPGPKPLVPGSDAATMSAAAAAAKNIHGVAGPVDKDKDKDATKLDAHGKPIAPATGAAAGTVPPVPVSASATAGVKATATSAGLAGMAGIAAATMGAKTGPAATGAPTLPTGGPPDAGDDKQKGDRFEWGKSTLEGWNEANLIHVAARKLLGKVQSVDGVGLSVDQAKTSALGSTAHGIQRLNVAAGASDAEKAHAVYAAAFADNVATDDPAKDAARKAAVQAGAHQPRGLLENMAANYLSNTGSSWSKTAISKERFQQAMFEEAVKGSQAYVSGQKGNAYSDYLRGRYGEWGAEQDAMACHLISNPDSSESPWNRNIGPATDRCVASGVPIGADTRGAFQNMAIQAMHPSRQKQGVFAALSYTYQAAKAAYGNEHPAVFALAHGEMARALSADEVNNALTMYQISGQSDLNSSMAPSFMAASSGLAADTGKDFATAYTCMATAAPYAARRLGYVSAAQNLSNVHTLTDLSAIIQPGAGESRASAMQVIMEASSSTLSTMETHKIPMNIVTNPDIAGPVFDFLGHHATGGFNTATGNKALRVVSKNLSTVGAPRTVDTLEAMYSYESNGGNIDRIDQAHVILATKAYQQAGAAAVRPHVIEVAHNQGYGMSDGAIPWQEIERQAVPYATGQVTDYRLAPVVGQMVNHNIPISRTNLQIVMESMASNGGSMNADHVRAVMRVGEAVKSPSSSSSVLEVFARAQASAHGIQNQQNMPIGEVLSQLANVQNSSGQNLSAGNIAAQIVQIQRQSGGMSDYQMQDPVTVEMLIDDSTTNHAFAPQAINVVTRLVGSAQASSNPGYINVVEEFLDNNGRMRDMDPGSFNAAIALAASRSSAMQGASYDKNWDQVRISPDILKMIQRDPGYSVADQQISSSLIDRILQKVGGNGGTTP